jgi:iron(III) transport system substrate-binding protein
VVNDLSEEPHVQRRRINRAVLASALALATTFSIAACGGDDGPADTTEGADLVIYSGRSENLVKGVLDDLAETTGVKVGVRYAGSSELAAQLLEEGEATKADLFFSQDAGALGALAKAGRLEPLDAAVTSKVVEGFSDANNMWVATSARARVVAYNPQQAPEAAEFTSIDSVLDPKYKGKVGYAPANASFHAFVTALRVAKGEEGAKEWLTKFKANEPRKYDNNVLVLDGVDKGESSLGLINHYYWYERIAEKGADGVTAKIRFLGTDDPGALINVAGVGILKGTDQKDAAVKAVNYLLSDKAQQYFADETAEYPVVDGVTSKHDLPPLGELTRSSIDLNRLDSLDTTLAMLNEVGLT